MKIYITEVEKADFNEFLEVATPLLTLDRLNKINKLKDDTDKVASTSAELLLSFAAEEYLFEKTSLDNLISGKVREGVTFRPVSWRKLTGGYLGLPYTVVEGKNGKPEFKEEGAPFFNISHTDNVTVVAVSDRPVGIDIEGKRGIERYTVDKAFGSDDAEWIESAASTEEYDERCLRAWTLREAYLKMKGEKLFSEKAPRRMFDKGNISEDITKNYNVVEERYDRYVITAINEKD